MFDQNQKRQLSLHIKTAVSVTSFLFAFLCFTLPVFAAPPGTLDTSFGTSGATYRNVSSADDEILALAVQPDNKIVAAGYSESSKQFTIARFNPNGSSDTAFGTGGIAKTSFGGDSIARAVAIQSDGKILVGGNMGVSFTLVRYTATGQMDTTFGNQGVVVTSFGNSAGITGLAVQTDGKIIATGYTDEFGDFALARYLVDGTLDTTFGGGTGKVMTDFSGDTDRPSSVKLQSDGKIVVAGSGVDADLSTGFAIARYNIDGSLDTSFNGGGTLITVTGCGANALGIQSDGKIVATGSTDDVYLARYNTNGSLDTSFGITGVITTNIGGIDSAFALTIDLSGSILVGGSTISAGNEDFFVAKYQGNGSLDPAFDNGDGIVITPLGTNSDTAYSVSLQPNGGIILGSV